MGGRARMPLLLTEQESKQLDDALTESLAPSRSFFLTEAINAGLSNPQPVSPSRIRRKRINVWLPKAIRGRIRELAGTWNMSQQEILRHFLAEYIHAASWRQNEAELAPAREVFA